MTMLGWESGHEDLLMMVSWGDVEVGKRELVVG